MRAAEIITSTTQEGQANKEDAFDRDYHDSLSETLSEWGSNKDDELIDRCSPSSDLIVRPE